MIENRIDVMPLYHNNHQTADISNCTSDENSLLFLWSAAIHHTSPRKSLGIYLFLLLFCVLAPANAVADTTLKVIGLKNRPAEEILPLVMPFLDRSDRIIANGSSLIIRSTPERLAEIEQLVAQLDSPLSNLVISVIQGRNIDIERMNAQARLKASIPLDQPSSSKVKIKGHIDQNEIQHTGQIIQQVRTMDGQAAQIQAGAAHPVKNRHYDGYNEESIEYIDTTTGFTVTPRLNGTQVIIEVSPWSDKMQRNGIIATQGAHTTFSAELGEWVEIGKITENQTSRQAGILSRSRDIRQDEIQILIKIEKTR